MKMTVIWDTVPCSPQMMMDVSEVHTTIIIRALIMEAVCTSEMQVNIYKNAWHNIPQDYHFHLKIGWVSQQTNYTHVIP
jgi:hypothetical protein